MLLITRYIVVVLLTIKKLTEQDAEELFILRKKAYLQRYSENLDVEQLKWSSIDKSSLIFGAYDQNSLISSYRGSLVYNAEDLSVKTQCPIHWLNDKIRLPVIYTGLACTHPSYQRMGIHLYLRRELMQFFIKRGYLRFISTSVVADRWTGILQQLGYQIYPHPTGWNNFIKNSYPKEIQIGSFDGLDLIKQLSGLLQRKYPNFQKIAKLPCI